MTGPDVSPRDGTRARIIAAGVELLDSEGIEAVGLRAIARAAGVSHGAPRRYFPTHRALLAAIARTGLDDLAVSVRPALTEADLPAGDRVIAAANAYVEFARRRRDMFELIFRHDILAGGGGDLRGVSMPLLLDLRAVVADVVDDTSTWNRTLRLWASLHGLAVLVGNRAFEPVESIAEFDVDLAISDVVGTALW